MKTLVSVIIVSYNTRDFTVKAAKSALSSEGFTKGAIEVIVVDNNSTDDTVSHLKKHLPGVIVISNPENKGFGAGNNQGLHVANGEYTLLLNSDAFLHPTSLKTMVDIMEGDNNIVSVGPQLLSSDGSLQQSAGYLPGVVQVLAWMWWLDKIPLINQLFSNPYHIYDFDWYKKDQFPEWLMGACLLFRKKELLQVGGFDEQIFMYGEEVELFLRLKQTYGKQVCFTSQAQVEHLGSVSTKKAKAYRLAYELKGIEYIYKKHYPHLLWPIKATIYMGVLLRLTIFSMIPSRRDTLVEYKKYYERSAK